MAALTCIDSGHPIQNTAFGQLSSRNENQQIRARLLRFWYSIAVTRSGDCAGTTLLLLDDKGSMMNAFLPAAIAVHHRQALSEGQIYTMSHFEIVKCPQMNKTTEHSYVIRFLEKTLMVLDDDAGPVIQRHQFMVRTYDQLKLLANTHLELPDVVSCIKSFKGYGLTDPAVLAPILIPLLIGPDIEVDLALLDVAAVKFNDLLNTRESIHSVFMITSIRPLRIGDTLYLSTSVATRFFSSPSVQAIAQFAKSLGIQEYNETSILENGKVIYGAQISPIADLNKFLSATTTQEILFSCKARIVDIVSYRGSCELSETTCMFTMDHAAIADPWTLCNTDRNRVELLVDDGTNYATLSVAYKDILNLKERSASQLLADEVRSDAGNEQPKSIDQLRGRVYVFHVLLADKFMSRTCPFTVCGISDCVGLEVIVDLARKCDETHLGHHSDNVSESNT